MATATSSFMRKQSRFPSGISSGGGDTSCAVVPQPTLMGVEFSSADTYKEIVLPAGTLLIAGVIIPRPASDDNSSAGTTAGTIKINKVTGGAGGTESTEYLAATSAAAYSRNVLNSGAGYQLSSETRIRFTPSSLDGVGRIAAEVILPKTRI